MVEPIDEPSRDASHPLVIAQKKNLGPLSAAGKDVWHGNATPCVTCCQLIQRNGAKCQHCGQDHGREMLEKMARHSGPWFVYDHVRPFPGVSLERITKLVERGVLTRTSIVRGPTSFYQWRFAGETPLLARLLGHCWNCQSQVDRKQGQCPDCDVPLDGRGPTAEDSDFGPAEETNLIDDELKALGDIAAAGQFQRIELSRAGRSGLGKMTFVFFLVTVAIVLIIVFIASRSHQQSAVTPRDAVVVRAVHPSGGNLDETCL